MDTRPDMYVTVYMPIAGWKPMIVAVDPDCGGMHTPWETYPYAFDTKEEAIKAGKAWADTMELKFFDDCPNQTEDAPSESVEDQLKKIFGMDKGG